MNEMYGVETSVEELTKSTCECANKHITNMANKIYNTVENKLLQSAKTTKINIMII